MKKQGFPKEQRLCNEKTIKELFTKGSSVFLYPFKITYLPARPDDSETLPQVLISVSKKRFKKASDRNLAKRRIREAYRLKREEILTRFRKENTTPPRAIGLIYVADDIKAFDVIQKKLSKALKRIKIE